MQNSAVMTLRAAVLLACFIAVPLFAIFGKQTPEVIREFIQSITDRATRAASSTAPTTNSPMFRPAPGAGNPGSLLPSNGAPALQSNPAARAQPGAPNDASSIQTAPAGGAGPAAQPGGSTTSLPPVTHTSGATGGVRLAGGVSSGAHQTAPKQSVYVQTGAGQTATISPAAGSALPTATAISAQVFREAEVKLRRLGATYYLLESLTPAGDSYRFFCKVAGSQPEAVVAFVATDSDPLRAMNTVVRQIESWKGQVQ